VNMALLIPKFWTKYMSNKSLILMSHIALIMGYGIIGFVLQEWLFLGIFYVAILLWNIYNPLYNAEIISQAHPDEIGEVSGMLGGLQSLFMFVGPLIGGVLLSQGVNVFAVASICCIFSLIVLQSYQKTK
jgi:hypothetical protein